MTIRKHPAQECVIKVKLSSFIGAATYVVSSTLDFTCNHLILTVAMSG